MIQWAWLCVYISFGSGIEDKTHFFTLRKKVLCKLKVYTGRVGLVLDSTQTQPTYNGWQVERTATDCQHQQVVGGEKVSFLTNKIYVGSGAKIET